MTTLYVAQGGSDSSNTCTSSASPCATISHAVTQAVSGDTIEVAGTIADHVDVSTSLTISQWSGQAAAVVNGSNSGTPFTIESGATVSLDQLTVENGEGYAGGGIHNDGTLTVTDSTITGNTADLVGGGGIYNASGTLTVTDSTISYNTANSGGDGGGGIYNYGGPLTVTDSTISNNTAPDGGGGINNSGGGTPTITASTISNNSATSGDGGGIESFGETWTVGATIVAANTGGNCRVIVTSVGYNLTDDPSGSTCGFTGTTDVIGANPRLGSLADNGGPTQTLLPAATSPAAGVIPLGTTLNGLAVCPGTDQRGVARPQPAGGSACTVGAVEVAPAVAMTTLYVAQGGSDSSNTCTSSASPCATISHAVTQAVSGDTIEVAGTIADHVDVSTSLTISQWSGQAAAVVNGSNSGTPFTIESGATVSLDQLTVENGEGYAGGGIHNDGTLTVTDSTITGNTADLVGGGGIYNASGTLTVTDSTISYNTANSGGDGGGGIYNYGGPLTVTDSTISNNTAPDGGGGINNSGGGTPTITASTISNNSATSGDGGGIESFGETWTVGATIVAANTGGNCRVIVTSVGYNLTDDPSGSTCGFTGTTDVIGANPRLGSLADNGGPTQTLLPAATSPAAGVIPLGTTLNGLAVCPGTDQRGVARPQPAGGSACTVGAVEVAPAVAITSPATFRLAPRGARTARA